MANETTATIVASLGHGTRTLDVFHSAGRPLPIADAFAAIYEIPNGVATGQISLLGAALTKSSYSEAGAAEANQALPALGTPAALTPAGYVVAAAPTSEAFRRVDAGLIDLEELLMDEMAYPLRRIAAYDTSIGIVYARFVGLSNRVGTSGATFSWAVLNAAYLQLCTQLGQKVMAVAVITLKQWSEMVAYGLTTATSSWGGPAANQLFLDLLNNQSLPSDGYVTSLGPIHIFVDPDPAGFQTVSGDKISAMFVPAIPGMNGQKWPEGTPADVISKFKQFNPPMPGKVKIAPAFGLGYRSDPAFAAVKYAVPNGMARKITLPTGVEIDVIPRGHAGVNGVIWDAFTYLTTVEINDNSGVGLRSVA